ncbi:YrhB domain-containing protein [Bradyrhizobium guangzhouense]|nr:YrhB domain-containing protein [Bradyrhizobium guangzhouense]
MDVAAAIAAFEVFIERKQNELGETLASLGRPERLSRGWAFYYQSRAYMETGEFSSMLVGHGPVVIKDEGGIIEGGSLDNDPEALLNRVGETPINGPDVGDPHLR